MEPLILQIQAVMLGENVEGSVSDNVDAMFRIADPLEEVGAEQERKPLLAELTAPPLTFISYFSKINVYRRERSKLDDDTIARGGSRGEPVEFVLTCKNQNKGCEWTGTRKSLHDLHELNCKTTAPTPPKPKLFQCEVCGASLASKKSLCQHMHRHKYVQKCCTEPPCDGTSEYKTMAAWQRHLTDRHSPWVPLQCPNSDECKQYKQWEQKHAFVGHLAGVHCMSSDDIKKLPGIFFPNPPRGRKKKEATDSWRSTYKQ